MFPRRSTRIRLGAFYTLSYGCDPRNVSKVRSIVERDLEEMQTWPVSEETLKQAKVLLLQQIPLSESSVDKIAAGLLSRATNGLPLNESLMAANIYANLTPNRCKPLPKWIRPHDFVQVTEGPDPQ